MKFLREFDIADINNLLYFAGTNFCDWFFELGINLCDFQKVTFI